MLDTEHGSGSSFAADTGSVIHKLLELYYGKQLSSVILPVSDMPDPDDVVQEALRIFSVYTKYYRADEWNVVGVEIALPGDSQANRQLMEETIGVSPFTCRIDAVVDITEEQAQAPHFVALGVSAGRYIVDHKTTKYADSDAILTYATKVQFAVYQWMYATVFPEVPVKGLIVNRIVRHKNLVDKSFQRFLINPPTDYQKSLVTAHLQEKQRFLATGAPNLDACDDWGGCKHRKTGACRLL